MYIFNMTRACWVNIGRLTPEVLLVPAPPGNPMRAAEVENLRSVVTFIIYILLKHAFAACTCACLELVLGSKNCHLFSSNCYVSTYIDLLRAVCMFTFMYFIRHSRHRKETYFFMPWLHLLNEIAMVVLLAMTSINTSSTCTNANTHAFSVTV